MKCEKCEIEMTLVEFGDPIIGDMGNPVVASYYECPKCKKWKYNCSPSANLLAQTIDKKILDKMIKDFKQETKS